MKYNRSSYSNASLLVAATLALALSIGCPDGSDPDDDGQTEHLSTDAGPGAVDAGGCALNVGSCALDDGGATIVGADAGSPDSGVTGPPPWADAGTCVGLPLVAQGGVLVEFCDTDEDCAYRNQDTYKFGCVFEVNAGHKACQLVDSCVTDDDCAADAGQSCRMEQSDLPIKRCVSACDGWDAVCGSTGFLGRMWCGDFGTGAQRQFECRADGCFSDDQCSGFSASFGSYVCMLDDGDGPGTCVIRCEL